MKILILSPHTDDAEFACGGSISRWLEEGNEVHCTVFSAARQSLVEKGLPDDLLEKEVVNAMASLGVENLSLLDYPVRNFPEHRQDILEEMVRLERDIKPDLVVMPSTQDTHQDHQTVSQEGFRAFKKTSLIGYEMPQNNLTFPTNMFVRLNSKDLDNKLHALSWYRSQHDRPYVNDSFIEGLMRVRGTQAGSEFAEAFEVVRWIW